MATKDPAKRRATAQRYRERKKIVKYGSEAAAVDMRGRHQNHARGETNPRWNNGRLVTPHGYVLVRVDPAHPRAFGSPGLKRFRYAYEHDLVMERALGRALAADEVVHHLNGKRDDNRPKNLVVETRSHHAREHSSAPGARDERGRFTPEQPRDPRGADPAEWPADLRVRQWPAEARHD